MLGEKVACAAVSPHLYIPSYLQVQCRESMRISLLCLSGCCVCVCVCVSVCVCVTNSDGSPEGTHQHRILNISVRDHYHLGRLAASAKFDGVTKEVGQTEEECIPSYDV